MAKKQLRATYSADIVTQATVMAVASKLEIPRTQVIARAVTALAESLGVTVTEAQADALRDLRRRRAGIKGVALQDEIMDTLRGRGFLL